MLSSKISSEVGLLTKLIFLHLDENHLPSLPTEIGNLSALKELTMVGNLVPNSGQNERSAKSKSKQQSHVQRHPNDGTGTMNLKSFLLESSGLRGSIPTELANVNSQGCVVPFQQLALQNNSLTGGLPSEFGTFSSGFRTLDLSSNPLGGSIPSQGANLTDLIELWLSNTSLMGTIPSGLRGLIADCINHTFQYGRECLDWDGSTKSVFPWQHPLLPQGGSRMMDSQCFLDFDGTKTGLCGCNCSCSSVSNSTIRFSNSLF